MRYITVIPAKAGKKVAVDDTILVKDVLASAGSHMLYNFVPLFDAEAVTRLKDGGYSVCGKTNVGEFGLDVLGETSYYGACEDENGALTGAAASAVINGDAEFALCTDLDGAPRRAAALSGAVFIKPTYGTVSRYGVIPCACSGEQIGVMAKSAAGCAELLSVIAGHDDKDGTSLPQEKYSYSAEGGAAGMKIGLCSDYMDGASAETKVTVETFAEKMRELGAEVETFSNAKLSLSQPAWRILLCGETCNNLSRYDGVKFGYRTEKYKNIDELYTNSRTESMTLLTKSVILYGSDVLSKGRYDVCYDRSLRIRRVLRGEADGIFSKYDMILAPACSKTSYRASELGDSIEAVYRESAYTSLASILGLPAIAVGGVQLIADSLNDEKLLRAAGAYEGER